MKSKRPRQGGWCQPPPRANMVTEVKSMAAKDRLQRFSIRYDQPGHIDDEVIVTLLLEAWRANQKEAETYASELLRRVTKHVTAHVRKNPGWQLLGGGTDTAIEDFCAEIVLGILEDSAQLCHAEVAFGDYVYKRTLNAAGKLYAKKNSAGQSLNNGDEEFEITAESDASDVLSASPQSPEQEAIAMEEYLSEKRNLEKVYKIVQNDLPELEKLAFSFRYFAGGMKIESKNKDEVTVTRLMSVTEKTATKYINQAIAIIKQRLSND